MKQNRNRHDRRANQRDHIFPPPFGGGVSSDKDAFPSTDDRGICTAVIGSMTQAMQAQELLAGAAIRARVTKVSSASTHTGCAYGVEVTCRQMENVESVLRGAGIRIRQVL